MFPFRWSYWWQCSENIHDPVQGDHGRISERLRGGHGEGDQQDGHAGENVVQVSDDLDNDITNVDDDDVQWGSKDQERDGVVAAAEDREDIRLLYGGLNEQEEKSWLQLGSLLQMYKSDTCDETYTLKLKTSH